MDLILGEVPLLLGQVRGYSGRQELVNDGGRHFTGLLVRLWDATVAGIIQESGLAVCCGAMRSYR